MIHLLLTFSLLSNYILLLFNITAIIILCLRQKKPSISGEYSKYLHPYLKGLFKNKDYWYLIMWPLALQHYILSYVPILEHPCSSVLS